ncbi:MAG: divalent-cation tolerance protein CutA [Bryobacteraceae bacterium]
MTDKIVVFSTCSSSEEAEKLARTLVEERLAACVSIVPGVQSIYRWRGQIESSSEYLLMIKTRRDRMPSLRAAFERLHSYEVPELLALSVIDGAPAYLEWLDRELPQQSA